MHHDDVGTSVEYETPPLIVSAEEPSTIRSWREIAMASALDEKNARIAALEAENAKLFKALTRISISPTTVDERRSREIAAEALA